MADAFDELKEKTIQPELQEVGSESSLPVATTEDTSSNPPSRVKAEKIGKKKNPKDGYRWLVSTGILLAAAIMIFVVAAKFLFGIQSAPEIASFYFKAPEVSKMEHLTGYGFSVFINSKRNLRFFTKEPVEYARLDKRLRFTSKDPIFQKKLETIEALFPGDKKDLEEHRQAIEIWERNQEELLLYDRVTGLYLLDVDAG